MNDTTPKHADQALRRRISHWQKEVEIHTDTNLSTDVYGPGGTKLRRSKRRAGLQEISVNKVSLKRKRITTTAMGPDPDGDYEEEKENAQQPGQRKLRGRPRRKTPQLQPNDSASGIASRSPVKQKKGVESVDRICPDASMTFAHLKHCDPPVVQVDFAKLLAEGYKIAPAVTALRSKLLSVPIGVIPQRLKTAYTEEINTPRKSKGHIDDASFAPSDSGGFPDRDLFHLKHKVDYYLATAELNQRRAAHERQWGSLALRILEQAEESFARLEVLNVENCMIKPLEVRPTRNEGILHAIDYSGGSEITQSSQGDSESIGRMVDWVIALRLTPQQERVLDQAYAGLLTGHRSVNQTLSYMKDCPIAIDIEIKKEHVARDSLVQLAIWKSAAIKKLWMHKWDDQLPMPGITVDGHDWKWVIFFPLEDGRVAMTKPAPFGSTESIHGIWTILHKLNVLCQWSTDEYSTWFETEVLGWARKRKEIHESSQKPLKEEMPSIGKAGPAMQRM